jgi:superfamily II DNA or RNA helicase
MSKKSTWDTQPKLREYIDRQREEVIEELDPKRLTTARKLAEWVGGEVRLSEGGYRRRQLLELLQNGVDAAQPVGAHIAVRVRAKHLYVANTGAPVTRDGIDALLSMHNSPKRGEIGKFGLGFKSTLGLGDTIDVISRSVSLRFDRRASREAVVSRYGSMKGQAIPVMRLAWALSPEEEAERDPLLAKLMANHDTVVRIALRDREARALISEELAELRHEFLLFTGKDIALDCDGGEVSVIHEGNDLRVLRDGIKESRWRVFSDTISIPAADIEATRDAGSLYGTKDLPIAWAVPLDRDRRDAIGQFWSFFPLAERNRVPGILNAPFKTNDDRSNLIDGSYNRALFECCASLIVASLPTMRSIEDTARHLDYLPRRDDGNNLAKQLGDAVWRLARTAMLAPDADGILRLSTSVRTPPTSDPALLAIWRDRASPVERARFAHADVQREDGSKRSGRWTTLVGAEVRIDAGEWLALITSKEPQRAAEVLDLADRLMSLDPMLDAKTWRIVPDATGLFRAGPELLLDGEGAEPCVLPALVADPQTRSILRRLGVKEKDTTWHKDRQIDARNRGDWDQFWARRRAAPMDARISEIGLFVRTRARTWRPGNLSIIGKQLLEELDEPAANDPANSYLADTSFHTTEELKAAGLNDERDDLTSRERLDASSIYTEWYWWMFAQFRSTRRHGPSPKLVKMSSASIVLDLLQHDRYRDRVTEWISGHTMYSASFGYAVHHAEYPDVEAWALKKYGSWNGFRYSFAWLVREESCLCEYLGISQEAILILAESLLSWNGLEPKEVFLAKAALARELVPDVLRFRPPCERVEIYEAAARLGVVPAEIVVGSLRVSKKDLRVSSRATDSPNVMVVSEEALDAFSKCGVSLYGSGRIAIAAVRDKVEGADFIGAFPLDERCPWVVSVLRSGIDACVDVFRLDFGEIPTISVDQEAGHMRFDVPDDTDPQVQEVLHAAEQLGWLRLPCAEALKAIAEADLRQSRAFQKPATGLAARLLALAGRPALEAQLTEVRGQLVRVTAERVAETFLWKFGPGSLRGIEESLREMGYAAPRRWGTATAREFAVGLGFPAEFGGSPVTRREASIEVDGPIECPDLHEFQREVREGLKGVLSTQGERAMVCLPTGAGKTRVVVEAVVEDVLRRTDRPRLVLWVAQQDELCEQAVETFRTIWRALGTDETLTISRLWAGNRPGPIDGPHVVVATMQTLLGRFNDRAYSWLRVPDVAIVDEAHHGIAKSYSAFLDWLDARKEHRMPVVGLSATPHRGANLEETRRLARRFDNRLLPHSERQPSLHDELLSTNVLARAEHTLLEFSVPQQLSEKEAEHVDMFHELPSTVCDRLADDDDRNEKILARVAEGGSARTLLFAASVRHARWLATVLTARGCPSAAIDGETPTATRRYFLRAFREGKVRVLVNYGVLTTGFDEPLVDMVIIARPTFSPVLYTQMMGRGLRGTANGGTATCAIVTVLDNWVRYKDHPAWKWFVEFWPRSTNLAGS